MTVPTPTTTGPADPYDVAWRQRYSRPERSRALAATLPSDPRLDVLVAFTAWREQRLDDALAAALTAVEDPRLTPRWQQRVLNVQAQVLLDLGLEHESLQTQLRALAAARASDDPVGVAVVTHDLAYAAVDSDPARATELFTRAVSLARAVRELPDVDPAAADEACALEALARFNLLDDPLDDAVTGDPQRARAADAELAAIEALVAGAWPDLAHFLRAGRALLAVAGPGAAAPSAAALDRARRLAADLPPASAVRDVAMAGAVARVQARVAVLDGRGDEAVTPLVDLLHVAPVWQRPELLSTLADVHEQRGDLAAALDAARRRGDLLQDAQRADARRAVRALEVWHRTRRAEEQAAAARATADQLRATMNELHRDRERLRARSRRDVLTGLWNRRHLLDTVRRLGDGPGHQVALLDVDRFKDVNDTSGHAVGDDVLRRIADAVTDVCGPDDTCVRYGGDEFVVLRPATSPDPLADDLAVITRLDAHTDLGLPVATTSIGVAVTGDDGFDAALAVADTRMYAAKRAGGGRLVGPDAVLGPDTALPADAAARAAR